MALKSDSQGFLIGDPVDIGKAVDQLRNIRSDVSEIKRALLGASNGGNKGSKAPTIENNAKVMPLVGRTRDSKQIITVATPNRSKSDTKLPGLLAATLKNAVTPNGRDAAGKFIKKGESGNQQPNSAKTTNETPEEKKQRNILSNVANRLTTVAVASASGAEEADPTIKAFKEVSEPMMRGYQTLFGGGDKDETWFKKIFKELNIFRKDESVFNKAQNNILKNIEGKSSGGGEDGQSFLGGLLGSISPWVMTAITGIGGALLTGIGTVLDVIFSPIGLAIGAAAGAAWLAFTDEGHKFFSDMSEKIATGWDKAVDWFIKSSPKTMELVNKGLNKANEGIDVVKKSSPKTIEALGKAKDWVLGKTSQLFESGKGGSGTVSSGKGDNGGASYGTYQLSSKQGTLQEFLKSSKYGSQFEGLTPGSKEFNAKWKRIAKDDPEFGNSQHEFIKNSHFDPQMDKLKNAGIDLSGRGAAVKDSVWSTAVQFGGKSSLIENALKGKDSSKLSDSDIISAIQDYKIANNDKLFAKSSGKVREGTLGRALSEKDNLLGLASAESVSATVNTIPSLHNLAAGPGNASQTQSAFAAAPKIPAFTPIPSPAEAPPQITPLSSLDSGRNNTVTMPSSDVGQDVRDRGIAHIATGGIAGRG